MHKLNNQISSRINKSLVLTLIHQNPLISRAQLALKTGLDRSTVTHILNYLLEEKLVEEAEVGKAGKAGGRCPILLRVNYSRKYFIAIELGFEKAEALICNMSGEITSSFSFKISRGESTLLLLDKILMSIKESAKREFSNTVIIGVSCPGIVDVENGKLLFCSFHEWRDVPIAEHIKKTYSKHVFVENDANTAAVGELKNYSNGSKSLIYFCIRSAPADSEYILGVGGGIILNEKLWRGANFHAGEVVETLNQTLKKQGVSKYFSKHSKGRCAEKKMLDELLKSAAENDSEAHAIIDVIAYNIGKYIGELLTFLDPFSVIIYIDTEFTGYNLLGAKISHYFLELLPGGSQPFEFSCSTLGSRAVIEGLILLSQNQVFASEPGHASILF